MQIKDLQHELTEDFRQNKPNVIQPKPVQWESALQHTFDNGLRLILVENKKLPVVTGQIFVDHGMHIELKAGIGFITGEMLMRGAAGLTKYQLDEKLDYYAARVQSDSHGLNFQCLSKYIEPIMELCSKILLYPNFPEQELNKVKTQQHSSLLAMKEDPAALLSNLKRKVNYGKDHQYGNVMTEDDLNSISRNDLLDYHKKWFLPNISYLVIEGDIDVSQVKRLYHKYLSQWALGEFVRETVDKRSHPRKRSAYIIHKEQAVQTAINITYPVSYCHQSPVRLECKLMNEIFGGYFSSRLNLNLREQKGYTYGIRSLLSPDRFIGNLSIKTNVGTDITADALQEIFNEMHILKTNLVPEEELQLAKNVMIGSFSLSLEDPKVKGQFALNIARFGLDEDYYLNYISHIEMITSEDIFKQAIEYLLPEHSNILLVGDRKKLLPQLEKIVERSDIYICNYYGDVISDKS